MKQIQFLIFSLLVVAFPISLFAQTPKTVDEILKSYAQGETIKILIVPGHDSEASGAEYAGIKEANLNLVVANALKNFLSRDKQLSVYVTRPNETYTPELANYFVQSKTAIQNFITAHSKATKKREKTENIDVGYQVPHAVAPVDTRIKLFGINKWADENDFDVVVHLHFNDYGSRPKSGGEYGGYAVYVPQTGLVNAKASKVVGDAIGKRLNMILNPSTMPSEKLKADQFGVIEDYELIALGTNNTLSIPSVLVEYSYIYEPAISNQTLFPAFARIVGQNTARGIEDFLNGEKAQQVVARRAFEYEWKANLSKSSKAKADVAALQVALKSLGFYAGDTGCPITGIFGSCTRNAVIEFQRANNISPIGTVGTMTRAVLNTIFK